MKTIAKYLFLIYVSSLCLDLIKCNENSYFTSLNFLEGDENKLSNAIQADIDNVGIKCFWLEPKTMSVFDLKNLKRPIFQK